ncbi:DnaJ domain-containing protein [Methylocystis borbori]|uniref:DnaJ domain-containing protein n=1 Tax=Methylocystis borbori TaxID=3118750 RepID=UPI002F9676C8
MRQPSVDEETAALRAALYVVAVPSCCAQLRNAPLADGVGALLRVVAKEGDALKTFAGRLEKSPEELQEAAAFYLEQVVLAPGADSYRVLGTQRHASAADLRQNLALLCKWLHSDICEDLARSVFFLRVTQAWNDLKTPERRAAYDAALGLEAASNAASRASQTKGDKKNAKGDAAGRESRRRKHREEGRSRRMVHPGIAGPRGLWRFILSGLGWRVR